MTDVPDAAVEAAAGVLLAEIALSEDDTKWCMAVAMKTLTAALPHLVGEMVGTINRMGERNDELDEEIAAWKKDSDEQIHHYNGLVNARDAEIARMRAALELVRDFPIPEQDNFLSANMRLTARAALEPPTSGGGDE